MTAVNTLPLELTTPPGELRHVLVLAKAQQCFVSASRFNVGAIRTLTGTRNISHVHILRAMATTVIMAVMALVSMTSLVLPTRTDPGSLKVDHVNVLLGRSNYDRQGRAREFAFAKFDIVSGA